MSTTPPRRRRSPAPPPDGPPPGKTGWLGFAALALGIVIAGLGIGALLAAFQQRNAGDQAAVLSTAAPLVTPVPAASRVPLAVATIVPPRSPLPSASPSASPLVSPSPSNAPSPAPTPSPTPAASPSLAPTAVPTPAPKPSPIRAALAVATPLVTLAPRSAPPTPPPVAAATPAPPTAAPTPTAGAMATVSAGVVRRYLDALIRGDETAAYAALGGSPGDRGLTLSEEAFLDPTAHITSIHAVRIDDSNAKVECAITSAKGSFYATFAVTAGPRGPYIAQHDYIKV
jgi:outer membrane biosynthesis protein TonB